VDGAGVAGDGVQEGILGRTVTPRGAGDGCGRASQGEAHGCGGSDAIEALMPLIVAACVGRQTARPAVRVVEVFVPLSAKKAVAGA
jgi:hypothetical protein